MQHLSCNTIANPFVPQATVMQHLSCLKSRLPSVFLHQRCNTHSLTLLFHTVMQHLSCIKRLKWAPFRFVASTMQRSLANPFVPQATVMQHLSCLKSGLASVVLHHRCNAHSLTLFVLRLQIINKIIDSRSFVFRWASRTVDQFGWSQGWLLSLRSLRALSE